VESVAALLLEGISAGEVCRDIIAEVMCSPAVAIGAICAGSMPTLGPGQGEQQAPASELSSMSTGISLPSRLLLELAPVACEMKSA